MLVIERFGFCSGACTQTLQYFIISLLGYSPLQVCTGNTKEEKSTMPIDCSRELPNSLLQSLPPHLIIKSLLHNFTIGLNF